MSQLYTVSNPKYPRREPSIHVDGKYVCRIYKSRVRFEGSENDVDLFGIMWISEAHTHKLDAIKYTRFPSVYNAMRVIAQLLDAKMPESA